MVVCPACGTDNPAGMKFCGECAAPLRRVCPSCGTPASPGQKFCGECASPLGADDSPALVPAPPGVIERRLCSVLFVDLVGFTTLSETRDPEEVRDLLSRYFESAETVIRRYGGVVEKFIGDAVMAVWGAPVASEQDAERAVRAALEVVELVAALGTQAGSPGLAARAGVVSGDVAVTLGAVGQGMVTGDTVNTAARVQTAAAPGSVLADGTTQRLAGVAVDFVDAGEHVLKGKSEPERLWRATRVIAGMGGSQRAEVLEAALQGRDAELRTVKELFNASAERRSPRLVVVSGAPGIGKTRLGWEFEKYIDGLAHDVWWHRGRCLSYGEGVAFWALAEAVRQRLSIAEEDRTDLAAAKLEAGLAGIVADPGERAYLAVRLGRLLGVPAAADTGGPLGREELFAGWRLFFERLAATGPVVWLVEDAQYADTGLLDFCDHLVDWARELPIFVLVFTRPELMSIRPGFGVGRNRSLLTLDPLDSASMEALVDSLVPGMPAVARARITAHAEGVPLFAVETVRSLIDQAVVVPTEGEYRLVGSVGELEVPDSLHGLLAARLDALDPIVRSLVADAAVLGTSFPAEAVLAVSDQDEEAVRAGLAELVRREVLEVSVDRLSPQRGSYRFSHQMLRQVAYDTLGRRDRKSRHLAVALHLRATFADDGEEAADVIARHYLDALGAVPDDSDVGEIRSEAMNMSVRAAERARRAGAPAAAATSYATASELAEAAGLGDAGTWCELAADAHMLAGHWDIAQEQADRARQLHLASGRVRDAARAQAVSGAALRRAGRHNAAREQLTAAIEVLRPDPDRDTVDAVGQLAALEVFAGGPDSERLTAEALELGQALDTDDGLMATLLIVRAIMHNIASRTVEAAACLREAARLAERAGDSATQARAVLNLSDTLAAYDPPAAAQAARTAIDLSRQVGASYSISIGVSGLVQVLLGAGEWDEAQAELDTALEGDGLYDSDYVQATRGWVAALRGDHATAAEVLDGLPQLHNTEDPQDRSLLASVEATSADAAGDTAEALRHARAVLAEAEAMGIRDLWIGWAWALAARSADHLGDHRTVEVLLEQLDSHPIGHVPPLLRAERDLARARLATRRDPTAAESLFESAIGGLRRLGDPYHLAHALLDHANYLDAIGDSDGAAAAVREAGDIAQRLGAAPLAARVRQAERQPVSGLRSGS